MLVMTGCYSFTTLGRARTVDDGKLELIAAPGVTATLGAAGDPNVRPAIEVGARYGVASNVDVGARVSSSGATATTRVQLVRRARLEALVAPGIAYTLTDKLAFELPVVVGINVGDDQIVFAPRVVYQLRTGLPHPLQFVFVGGSVGYVWQLTARFALMPELGVLTAVFAEPGYGTFTEAGPALQAALTLLWD